MTDGDRLGEPEQPAADGLTLQPSVQDYLSRLLQSAPAASLSDWTALLERMAPWAELAAEGLLGAQLPLQFTKRLLGRWLGEQGPNELGLLACTIAYQQAIQQAIPEVLGSAPPTAGQVRRKLRAELPGNYDFAAFTLSTAHQHPFLKNANRAVEAFVEALDLRGNWPTRLSAAVQRRFVPNLRLLLSHGQTRERFAPFRDLIALEAASSVVQQVVRQHIEYQRARFEDLPVLGREPFSLAQIYVEPLCTPLSFAEQSPKWLGISVARVAAIGYRVPLSPRLLRAAFLPYADLSGVVLEHVDLQDSDLIGADLQGAKLRASDLRRAELSDATLNHADLQQANLQQTRLARAHLREADLRLAQADRACLAQSDLANAKLDGATFWSADLQGAHLEGAQLQDVRLDRAILTGANLAHANLRDGSLRGTGVRGADCRAADLSGTVMVGANAWGAILRGANLEDANLSGADLSYADLRGANLKGANLRSACLCHARLDKATLTGALTHQTQFSSGALTTRQCNSLADKGAGVLWRDDD